MEFNFNFASSLKKDTINQKLILWYCFEMMEKSFNSILDKAADNNIDAKDLPAKVPKYNEMKELVDWWVYRRDYYGDDFLSDQEMLIKLINLRKYL